MTRASGRGSEVAAAWDQEVERRRGRPLSRAAGPAARLYRWVTWLLRSPGKVCSLSELREPPGGGGGGEEEEKAGQRGGGRSPVREEDRSRGEEEEEEA